MAIIRTNLCLTVTCKCGNTVAATMIFGGSAIDEEFTMTIAEVYNRGGVIEIMNTTDKKVKLNFCSCNQPPNALVFGKPCDKWCGNENCKELCNRFE